MFNPPDPLTSFSLTKIQKEQVKISRKGFKIVTHNYLDVAILKGTNSQAVNSSKVDSSQENKSQPKEENKRKWVMLLL